MGSAAGLFFAAVIVATLVYTKPSFFWQAPQMKRACRGLTDRQSKQVCYAMTAAIALVALLIRLLEN